MKTKLWPRVLSEEDLNIITSWSTLAEKEPELGQCCLYRIIAEKWSGQTETGVWGDLADYVDGVTVTYTRQRTFIDERGWLASDPNQTYWTPFDPEQKATEVSKK